MTARPIITGDPASSCSRATVDPPHRNAPNENARPGRLIAIEGPGGVGRTTITQLVAERLRAGGMPAVVMGGGRHSARGDLSPGSRAASPDGSADP